MIPTATAVAAALAVAREHDLPTDDPRVVRDKTNLLVHLRPAPVVARVPLTLALLRPHEWFRQELELARWLADRGAPVAPPAAGVDPGPYPHGDVVVGFWTWIDHDPDRADAAAAGRSLRVLHEVLADYRGALPDYDRLDEVARLLDLLERELGADPADVDRLRAVHAELSRQRPPGARRPLHGDAHLRNVLWSPSGPLWSDLENACAGPVEYDLACLAWRRPDGTQDALTAYGRHDASLVGAVDPYLSLFLAAWTIAVVARAPTDAGRRESGRRIERAAAYAREM